MAKINKDIDDIINFDEKKKILANLKQDDLLGLFKKQYKTSYRPIVQKKVALDQSISIAITKEEKEWLGKELVSIKKTGGRVTLSAFVRNRSLLGVDLVEWKKQALLGLKELNGPSWDKRKIINNRNKCMKKLEKAKDDEAIKIYKTELKQYNNKLRLLNKPAIKRSYRLRGRVTFNEANTIRWRAARLSLTVADYIRFLLFDYVPFSDNDKTLTIENRKRFYVSIIDVANSGWGTPPQTESCPNCARYIAENKELREKIKRLQAYIN